MYTYAIFGKVISHDTLMVQRELLCWIISVIRKGVTANAFKNNKMNTQKFVYFMQIMNISINLGALTHHSDIWQNIMSLSIIRSQNIQESEW